MSKYLQVIESCYDCSGMSDRNYMFIREAATLYAYLLRSAKIEANGIGKVMLVSSDSECYEDFLDVIKYNHPLKHLIHLNETSDGREVQKAFIDEVTEALICAGASRGWDVDGFERLRHEVEQRDYKFFGSYKKKKSNPSRKKTALISWKTDNYLNIGVTINEKDSHAEKWIPIIRIGIGLGLFESLLGELMW
ncbi:MAG: hypothetical protein FWF88_11690, partial [Peptococcaceae bacterium]|nr:hypothetical protein [Peptococcaceae bacterium]